MRALALVILLLAPTAQAAPCQGLPGDAVITAQLFFGRAMKGGHSIDAKAWDSFLAESVTPRFPDGLTVIEARGQWRQRSSQRIISEASTIVEIVTDDTPATLAKLEAIRTDYRKRFSQESVGLVINQACASW